MNDLARRMLSVDLNELSLALAAEGDLRWYFDTSTGDVILVNHEYDPGENGGLSVAEIEADSRRFLRVPPADPRTAVADMQAWLSELTDGRLKESLELALAAPRPDRRFKAALAWLPEVQERWHAFRNQRCELRARAWLESHGIDPHPRVELDRAEG